MTEKFRRAGYEFDDCRQIWIRPGYGGISYNDGDGVEERIRTIISSASDVSVLSSELREYCTDWPSTYHLSSARANILRPFESMLTGDILEIGSGCGAITRYLGECGAHVTALEGTPRRASITRLRVRDLANVQVVSDQFDRFESGEKFDIVTLIGVLEYANLFTNGANPHVSMLERAKSFLKPGGVLIVAIENQLGLKYLAGAPEDHLGQAMYGVESRYTTGQAQTFGKVALSALLQKAGFQFSRFLAPFPDYKLAVSVVTEEGFQDKHFDASALAWQSVRHDPQLPTLLSFSPELVWKTLWVNELALDMANSFVVLAHNDESSGGDHGTLAYHYSTGRRREFCKETVFRKDTSDSICVTYRSLSQASDDMVGCRLLAFSPVDRAPYIRGQVLSEELLKIITRDDWHVEEVCAFLRKYLKVMRQTLGVEGELDKYHPTTLMPGVSFDRLPQNIVESESGGFYLIDAEWEFNGEIELGFLVFRCLRNLLSMVTRIGRPKDIFEQTPYGLIEAVMEGLGWTDVRERIENYLILESQIQAFVAGTSARPELIKTWLFEHELVTRNVEQELFFERMRNSKLEGLSLELKATRESLSNLQEELRSVYRSASWRITRPARFIARYVRQGFTRSS